VIPADPIELYPGTDEWVREMTASKVAAVLGLSPWQSPFSLWYEMAGAIEHAGPTTAMQRGHYLEDAIARWLGDQHGVELLPGLCWRSRTRPWQVASPDRLVLKGSWPPDGGHEHWSDQYAAVAEVKTAADFEHWGPDGSDEIPVYYRAQAVWQMDTLGLDTAYVGVLLPRLELRSYVLHPAPGEAEFIREKARAFLDSLAAGDPPDVDTHSQTYAVLRKLHPSIVAEGTEGWQVDLPLPLARGFAQSVFGLREAEDEFNLQRSRVARYMGDAARGVYEGRNVALRLPGPKGTAYVKAGTDRVLAAVAEKEDEDVD
jgi:putative phage-type endonuclease